MNTKTLKTKMGKLLQTGFLIAGVVLSMTISSTSATELVHDDFNGTQLAPIWRLHSGYATVADGWVSLSGSTPGTRGGYIVTGENSNWSDYHLTTRVIMEGGGDNWYNAPVKVRVQTLSGHNRGTYYEIELMSSLWSGGGAGVALLKCVNDVA